MDTADWICQNTTLKNRPFSFDRYPFQREIAADLHPNMSCVKISQVGLTEVQIRKIGAFLKRNQGCVGIFAFPDDDLLKRNSQTRIKPIIDGDEVFNMGSDKPVRSISLMQIGQSFLHITGGNEADATSTSADILFLDEVDLAKQAMIALFGSRLQGSDWKILQKFSTPTFSGYGIDQDFEGSDQKYWMIRCGSCNHWQFPTFSSRFVEIGGLPSDIEDLTEIDQSTLDYYKLDLLNAHVCCEKCRAPLDLGRADNRAYTAKYPSRTHARGYRVNPFSVNTLPISYIVSQLLNYKKRDFLRGFKNTVLGLADDTSKERLSEAEIHSAFTGRETCNDLSKDMPTWIGIDVGLTCHITVGQGETIQNVHVVLMETCPVEQLFEKIELYKRMFNIVGGLGDRHPYTPTLNALRDQTQGKILPCEYRGTKEFNEIKGPIGEILHVQADRTTLLDEVPKAIRNGSLRISGYGNQKSLITAHLRNMVRKEEPERPATWEKLDPADHYFHSIAFMLSSIKLKNFELLTSSTPQTHIGIASANIQGYNTGILGSNSKSSNIWQPLR